MLAIYKGCWWFPIQHPTENNIYFRGQRYRWCASKLGNP